MNKTLLASAIGLAFFVGAPAFAEDDNASKIAVQAEAIAAAAARDSSTSAALTNAFNTSTATATSTLTAAVTGNTIASLGNSATNSGNANGAAGGSDGNGGNGGKLAVDAGTFSMSNDMTNVGQSAAGVMSIIQNSGPLSLAQQSNNIQANLNVGK